MNRQHSRELKARERISSAIAKPTLADQLPAGSSTTPVRPPSSIDDAALSAFADSLHSIVSKNSTADDKRLEKLRKRESFLFAASTLAAVLVPVLIVLGLILAFTINNHVAGALASSAGALSGAGSAGLFTLRRQTAKEIRPLEEKSDLDERLYRALQVARIIRDPGQQASALAALAGDIMRQDANRRIEIEEERAS